jgi:hypothetical protein
VSTGGLGVHIDSIELWEVRRVKAPETSKPDFTDVTVPQASPSSVRGEGAELGTGDRGGTQGGGTSSGSSASIGSFVFSLHLEVAATLATIILQASSR